MSKESLNYYRKKAKILNPIYSENTKKIGLLANFTVEGLTDVLKVLCNDEKIDVKFYDARYNQYNQEIINKNSGWNEFCPDLSFIILNFESMVGNAIFEFYTWDENRRKEFIKQTCDELESLLIKAKNENNGKIIISKFILSDYSPMGIFDSKIKYSLNEFVNSLNNLIQNLALEHDTIYCLYLDSFVQYYGNQNVVNNKWRFLADMKISPSYFPKLGEKLLGFIKPLFGLTKKCLVLDLDNTLWGGILGEEGVNGILLDDKSPGNSYLEFQKIILQLWNRGIILAINSKNNYDDVKEVFEKHPKMILQEKHFASIHVNWNDKATNMISISKDLNIGINSLVFWDDDPINRELIKQKCPEVFIVNVPNDSAEYSSILKNLQEFNSFSITNEDIKKGQMYATQNLRVKEKEKFSNIEDFLTSLDMKIGIKMVDEFTIPRIAQLTMKTNQFNLTTNRYTEEEIKKMAEDPTFLIKTFSVSDKFGENGLTGLYIIKKENSEKWIIDSFLMSCRIMGRNIEQVMIDDLIKEAKKFQVKKIHAKYIPTNKNIITKDLYQNFKFKKINDEFILENFQNLNFDVKYIEIQK